MKKRRLNKKLKAKNTGQKTHTKIRKNWLGLPLFNSGIRNVKTSTPFKLDLLLSFLVNFVMKPQPEKLKNEKFNFL